MNCRVPAIQIKVIEKNGMGPPQSITRPFGSGMNIKGNPEPKFKKNCVGVPPNSMSGPSGLVWILRGTLRQNFKKMAWGSPQKSIPDPYLSTQPDRPQEKRGDESAPPPEPYQATCPQHGEDALESKPLCPHVEGNKGLIPTTLAQWLWGSLGEGLIGIWKPPLTSPLLI
ncbi:hypothetical protein AB205_0007990, partial [Aquarana catesbeiana]